MYYETLTPKEQEVYNRLVYNGMNAPEIANSLNIGVNTVKTHLNSICNKLAIEGRTRVNQLIIWHYQGVLRGREKMKNCTLCKFDIDDKCQCTMAEDYEEPVNEYMICREFQEKKENDKSN